MPIDRFAAAQAQIKWSSAIGERDSNYLIINR